MEAIKSLIIDRRGPIVILTMNRPDVRNAVNAELTAALSHAYDELEADDDVWVVVLTGAGTKAFSAGADLKEMGERRYQRRDAESRPTAPIGGFGGITGREFAKPLVAAVNGLALGGGFEMTLACDLVVAEEHAVFGLPEAKRGIVAAAGGIVRLAQRIPLASALELGLTGEPISARHALQLGLINRVVPSGTGLEAALGLAEQLCTVAPLAARLTKRIMRASIAQGELELFALQMQLMADVSASDDAREGILAFAEKRTPQWQAR
jgi:crotonobetainyl-CoA hydratase